MLFDFTPVTAMPHSTLYRWCFWRIPSALLYHSPSKHYTYHPMNILTTVVIGQQISYYGSPLTLLRIPGRHLHFSHCIPHTTELRLHADNRQQQPSQHHSVLQADHKARRRPPSTFNSNTSLTLLQSAGFSTHTHIPQCRQLRNEVLLPQLFQ